MSNRVAMRENIGKYRLESVLGKGAMGVVYRAFDPLIERTVALKTIRKDAAEDVQHQEMIDRFRKEAQAAGRLMHPNIVAIHEYGEDDEVAFIAMEFIEGTPLSALLGEQPAAMASTLGWMRDLLDALAYSHEQGVVHRDIKPANLLVTRDGRIKISDFGIARIESSTLTQTGAMLGTPSYMSPEQFRCEAVDGRSDLFSAGIVLYQLLTGKRPFSGSASTVMQQILNHTPPQPSMFNAALPAGFDSIVMRALAKQPAERFSSARAFLQALLATQQGQAIADADSDATILATPAAAQLFTATLGGPADQSSAATGTADLAPWKRTVFPSLELILAQQIGPMARLLLKKIGAMADDFDALCQQLLPHIPSPAGRARFEEQLADIRLLLAPPPAPEPVPDSAVKEATLALPVADVTALTAAEAGATLRMPPAPLLAPRLTPEFSAAIVPRLAAWIGPIASIVAKRAARECGEDGDLDAFLQLLALHIDSDAERQRFIGEARSVAAS
ncbi:serine/threonine-protein kinase [Janthinobacterium agaricidamnosum]|uniref:non-specific serine/threonine protein kinase n=1 Tax=Janthinobacterium agaricidamnosum NBRC 102515 = DSM 9628 TaxID=1349767 RepID=W0VE83_9BURK|nr:serine/threonine-protein kinase [Janthinobacterium agaricidamnosum]CDG85990.1 kinase domain protein [Janthinobacterium agaricidamnosum NBRC 102515 = DSM 9628]